MQIWQSSPVASHTNVDVEACMNMQVTNLAQQLSDSSFVGTVFAPTDDAFTSLLSILNLTPTQALSNATMLTAVRWCLPPVLAVDSAMLSVLQPS